MTKSESIHWCNKYLTSWGGNARPMGWKWRTSPITSERVLYCGTQVVREKDCELKQKENNHGTPII